MEAADGSGGDSRCVCPPWPTDGTAPAIPCDGKTAHVAYILMAEPNDTNGDSHNNGKYAMYLTVSQPGADKGPNQIQRRREPQSGEDAAHALRRVAQDAARVVQVGACDRRSPQSRCCRAAQPPQPAAQPGRRRWRTESAAGRSPGDDAHLDGVARRRHDSGEVHAGRRAGVAAAGVEQRAGRCGELRADRARRRRRDRQRHRRHPALDAVEHSEGHARRCPKACRRPRSCPTARARSARAARTIAARARRPSGPAHHYVFELYALDSTLDVPAVGQSPPLTRAAVVAAMAGNIRGKGAMVGLFKR